MIIYLLDQENSYQCVIAADDNRNTYVQYHYGDIEWTFGTASSVPAQVGFDAGDGINFYAVPGSQTLNISDIGLDSNVGKAGQWMFRLDSTTVIIPGINLAFTLSLLSITSHPRSILHGDNKIV